MKKIGKVILAMLVIMQMIMVQAVPILADDYSEDPGDPNGVAEISLMNGPIFDVDAGKTQTIELKIRNTSAFLARSVVIQPTFPEAADTPFSVQFENNANRISSFAPHSEKIIAMKVTMDATAATKNYPITLNYTFFNKNSVKSTGSNTIYLRVKNITSKPEFMFEDLKLNPSYMNPGDSAQLSGYITNNSAAGMYDVEMSLEGLEATGIGISNGLGSKRITKIGPASSQTFAFQLVANSEMKGGTYPITLKLKYKDDSGKQYEDSQIYYVNVGGASGAKPSVQIINMKEPQGVYGVNQNFNISFDLKNTGESEAKNIKVTATAVGEGEVVPKSSSIQNLNILKAGQSSHFTFTFAGTSAGKTQNYPIEFIVEYESSGGSTTTFKQYAGVNISNPDNEKDEKTSKPKIIVSDYKCDPLIVMAGKEFDLNLTLMNSHKEKAVKNIKMFLTLSEETSSDTQKTGNIFTPVNSSNTFYFDDIPAKGKVQKNLRLFVVPDAQPKTYTLTVNFEYEDMKGNEFTATELLGINVKQVSELEIDEFELPSDVEQGMPVSVSFNYYNKGKVTLNNVMIRIEGDVESSTKNTYVGNMESGSGEYYEGEFYANTIGEVPVSIVITYDDPSGETQEVRRDFTINVTEPFVPDDMGGDMDTPSQASLGTKAKVGIIVAIIVVIAGIGGAAFIKRKRRLKEEAFLAADNDDEVMDSTGEKGMDANEHL